MSRAIGLVKFPNGNIYISCYDGISDYMYSPLITKTDLTDNYNGDLFGWNDYVIEDACSETEAALDAARKDNSEETVEVYSDYGGGFWWSGKASEKHMCITERIHFGMLRIIRMVVLIGHRDLWTSGFTHQATIFRQLLFERILRSICNILNIKPGKLATDKLGRSSNYD